MTGRGVRFHPPPVEITPEISWVLLRAFGPPDARSAPRLDPARALEVARALGLTARIAARQTRQRLEDEVGPEATAALLEDRLAAAGRGMKLTASVRRIAGCAETIGIPLVLLKFAALYFSGAVKPGLRWANDVDVLVAPALAPSLQKALLEHGYRRSDQPVEEQHLPLLEHPELGLVEVHHRILGVRPGPGEPSMTVADLLEAGLVEPSSDLPGSCAVPRRDLLAAHAIVHAVAQHGMSPSAYSMAWMIGDLIDLGVAAEAGEDWTARVTPWIAGDVSEDEVSAALRLARTLAAGSCPAKDRMDSPQGILCRHVLAGSLDPTYEDSMRPRAMVSSLTDRSGPWAALRNLLRTIFPAEGQLAKIYGRPTSRLALLRLRLVRPFDLLRRLLRYTVQGFRRRQDRAR